MKVDGQRIVEIRKETTVGVTSVMVRTAVPGEITGAQSVAASVTLSSPICSFEDLVDRHQQEIYRYSLQLTCNRADADDLYQETLIKAFRAFGRLDENANHRAWLYKICTNTFLSSRRKLGRESVLDEVTELSIPVEQTDHASSLDARALLQEVEAFVNRLPDKQRIALILRKYHESGYDQIAATLNCSEAAARANVHEALRKLRDCFGDRL